MKSKFLSNDNYEILEYENGNSYIRELSSNKYYYKEKLHPSQKSHFPVVIENHWNTKDTILAVLISLSILSFAYIFSNYRYIYNADVYYSTEIYIYTAVYVFVSICCHEAAHFGTMLLYGRHPGKIRFRRYTIFLNIVTTTTDSYLLPRYRRFFVYYAGIMVNLIIYGITLLAFPDLAYLLRVGVGGVIYNLIPFGGLKTDGYHMFINSILDTRDMKRKRTLLSEIAKFAFFIFAVVTLSDSVCRLFGFLNFFDFIKYICNAVAL